MRVSENCQMYFCVIIYVTLLLIIYSTLSLFTIFDLFVQIELTVVLIYKHKSLQCERKVEIVYICLQMEMYIIGKTRGITIK